LRTVLHFEDVLCCKCRTVFELLIKSDFFLTNFIEIDTFLIPAARGSCRFVFALALGCPPSSLRVTSLHFTSLRLFHFTSLYFTSPHFTHFTPLHFTSLKFFSFTSPHFTALHFNSLNSDRPRRSKSLLFKRILHKKRYFFSPGRSGPLAPTGSGAQNRYFSKGF